MCSEPNLVVLLHLTHQVIEVAFVEFEPGIEAHGTFNGLFGCDDSGRLLQRDEQAICHFSQTADDLKRFSGALITVAHRFRPARGLEPRIEPALLGDVPPAANVGIRLSVGQVQDGLMDTPVIGRGLIEPHFLRELAERRKKDNGRSTEEIQLFGRYVGSHSFPLTFSEEDRTVRLMEQ
jgi:hypothetical protein